MNNDNEQIKRMADLLKSGATMISENCPECNTPLFKINGEVWCPKCNKRVIIVKEGEGTNVASMLLLEDAEKTIMTKLQETSLWIRNEKDPSKLRELGSLLSTWLEALERLRRIQGKPPKNLL
jgi:UPF0148 protein